MLPQHKQIDSGFGRIGLSILLCKAPLLSLWDLSLFEISLCEDPPQELVLLQFILSEIYLFGGYLSERALFSFIERLLEPHPLSATHDTSATTRACKGGYENFVEFLHRALA